MTFCLKVLIPGEELLQGIVTLGKIVSQILGQNFSWPFKDCPFYPLQRLNVLAKIQSNIIKKISGTLCQVRIFFQAGRDSKFSRKNKDWGRISVEVSK